jgi:hypothetical protein
MGQVQEFEHIPDDFLSLRSTDLVGNGKEIQKLPDLHSIINAKVIWHVTDVSTNIHRLLIDAKTVDRSVPASALKKCCKKTDRSAFSCTVGTDESEEFSGLDLHIDRANSGKLAVVFTKID